MCSPLCTASNAYCPRFDRSERLPPSSTTTAPSIAGSVLSAVPLPFMSRTTRPRIDAERNQPECDLSGVVSRRAPPADAGWLARRSRSAARRGRGPPRAGRRGRSGTGTRRSLPFRLLRRPRVAAARRRRDSRPLPEGRCRSSRRSTIPLTVAMARIGTVRKSPEPLGGIGRPGRQRLDQTHDRSRRPGARRLRSRPSRAVEVDVDPDRRARRDVAVEAEAE